MRTFVAAPGVIYALWLRGLTRKWVSSAELVGATDEVGSLPAVTAELRRSAGALAELCNGSSSPMELFEVSHAVHYALVRLDDLVQLDEWHKACLARQDASKAKSVSLPGSSS